MEKQGDRRPLVPRDNCEAGHKQTSGSLPHQEKIPQEAIRLIKLHVIPQANGESKMIFFNPVWSAQVTFTVLLVFVGYHSALHRSASVNDYPLCALHAKGILC